MALKLTDAVVKRLPIPAHGNKIFYDEMVAGFGCRVTAKGHRSFVLNYRAKATGIERRPTIGTFGDWTTTTAREEARRLKRQVDMGIDPVRDAEAERAAPSVSDLADRFIAEFLPTKRASTRTNYKSAIELYIRPRWGTRKVTDIGFGDADALHRYVTTVRCRPGKRAVGGPYRANRVAAVGSGMFRMAMRLGWTATNPFRGIEWNHEEK